MENKYTCPRCHLVYTAKDVTAADSFKACFLLYQHGMSLRAIGRLFNLGPQSVKWRIEKYEETHATSL